jgi:hypothetical protein
MSVSKTAKLLKYLQTGASVTPRQITGSFGLANPHDAIYQLRNQGVCIYTNKATLANGSETVKYRIGTPTRKMVRVANLIFGASAFTR